MTEEDFKLIYSKKIEKINSSLQAFLQAKQQAEKNKNASLLYLAEAAINLLLIDLDRFVLWSNIIKEHDLLVRHVYEKHLVILIYEFFDRFSSTQGNKILAVIKSLPESKSHQEIFKELSSEIRLLKKLCDKPFKKIRDKIGAHRDPDINLQIDSIKSLDSNLIRKVAGEIEPWLGKVYSLLLAIFNDYKPYLKARNTI
jgi:hypothetical protein